MHTCSQNLKNLSTDSVFLSLRTNSKVPSTNNWSSKDGLLATDVIKPHTEYDLNIGIQLGYRSGIYDIDCDCDEAVALAKALLPNPLASFSRSSDSAHYFYKCEGDHRTKQYKCNDTLIELRGSGGQTMLPPSVHPDGDVLEFDIVDPSSPNQEWNELELLCRLIAAGALLAREWHEGSRHSLALGFAGLCKASDIPKPQVESVIDVICELNGDLEKHDRINCVNTTYVSSNVSGYSALKELLPSIILEKIANWIPSRGHNSLRTSSYPVDVTDTLFQADLTDARVAQSFVQSIEDRVVYIPELSQWYLWKSDRWVKDSTGEVVHLFHDFVTFSRMQNPALHTLKTYESLSKAKAAIELSQHPLSRSLKLFDKNDFILGCRNGALDLKEKRLHPHSPSQLLLKRSEVDYIPTADCPVFKRFLDQVFGADKELITYVQKVVGYCLTGSISEQAMFVLIGEGANGKSTFINTIAELLSDYSRTAASWTLVQTNRTSVGDDLVHLVGARLISMSETEQGQHLAESKVKQMTGGDWISGRKLYGEQFDFQITGKIFLASNNKPEITGADHGIWRRIHVVPFNKTFSADEQDRELSIKLKAEMSGILNWALEGFSDWQADGRLVVPKAVSEATNEYRDDMDLVAQFISEEYILGDASDQVRSSQLYKHYKDWCKSSRVQIKSDKEFKKSLLKISGITEHRTSVGIVYRGLSSLDSQFINP